MKKIFIVLVVLVSTVFGLGILKFGFKDGTKINVVALLCALENRAANETAPEGVKIYDIIIADENWKALTADLPESGREKQKIIFKVEGESYKAKIRLRGHLKLHWGGQKKSLRVYFDDASPFGTITKMNFLNPKTFQFTNDHIGTWVGKSIGAKTLQNEMVFLRINGENYGLMEMIEQPSRNYAINNGLGREKVSLLKGDYLREEDGHTKTVNLWESADHWKGKKVSKAAINTLKSLVGVLNNDELLLLDRFKAIEEHVVIDEYLKYYAALTVINTEHIDQTHNQVIVFNEQKGKYYPVIWDPTFMWAHAPERFYNFYDPLSYYILQNPRWREKRDHYIYNYINEYVEGGKFLAYHTTLEERLLPAVKRDHNKCNPIGVEDLNTVYRFSNSLYGHSNKKLRKTASDYYQELARNLSSTKVQSAGFKDSLLNVTYSTFSPIIVNIECMAEVAPDSVYIPAMLGQVVEVEGKNIRIKLFGKIEHEDGPDGSMYKIFSGFVQKEQIVSLKLGASIKGISITNALTAQSISF